MTNYNTALKKVLGFVTCKFLYLLVKWSNGKAMQKVRKHLFKKSSVFKNTMGEEQFLFNEMLSNREKSQKVTFSTLRSETVKTKGVFSMLRNKLQSLLKQALWRYLMSEARHAIQTAREDTLGKKKVYNSTYETYTRLGEESPVAKHNLSKRQLHLRSMYAYKMLPRSRPFSSNFLGDISC